jgi:IS5 family transposase
MVKYTSTKQISIEEFEVPFTTKLDKNNRWVHLANQIPWDKLAEIYSKALSKRMGRPAKDARIAIGAMIIKHKKRLPDEETIPEIQENPYLQYFLGLKAFTFDRSFFVNLRKRLGKKAFEELNQAFMESIESIEQRDKKKDNKKKKNDLENPPSNQGKLILDAVVAPQDIKFPTDLDLLSEAREHTERIIDELYEPSPGKRKPRTYRRNARKEYLKVVKKKKKSKNELHKGIRKQLNYVRRNINTIKILLDPRLGEPISLNKKDLRTFWIIQELYRQQKQMHDNRTHKIEDRIVSISQPYVRPIVRGKAGKEVEFGSKLSASLVKGFIYLDHLSWDAFNESLDLKEQVERYKARFGFYPELVSGDNIYGTRKNRGYLKERDIKFSGKALGRPPKLTAEEKKAFRSALRKEPHIRSWIEGKFGEGKRRYDLGCIKAKTMETSESWIAAVFFVMNLARWLRADSFLSALKWLINRFYIAKERFESSYLPILSW